MRVVAILQARMGSTRLPGKVLLPLAGKPMLQNIIERVQRATRIHEVMVTCPIADAAAFAPIIEACRVRDDQGHVTRQVFLDEWFGDDNDLVGRYRYAAIRRNADLIVRVPCDNPCVDPFYIDQAIEDYLDHPYLFYSNTTALLRWGHRPLWIDGLGAEVFSMSRLKWLDWITKDDQALREHPHKYFLDRYRDNDLPDEGTAFGKLQEDLRLDVNTQDDYDFIASIYNHFWNNRFTAEDILACPLVQERLHGRR